MSSSRFPKGLPKGLRVTVAKINGLEAWAKGLSDAELKAMTDTFRRRLRDGETTDRILPEAFAVVREAARRTIGLRHYDVQMAGGIVLHEGKIAEMQTGEGKTLVATLSAYLNAIGGRGVHVVTVNDYLATRDSEWMGPVYRLLGISVGCIQSKQAVAERRLAYESDITYGTNKDFGFDYLRDELKRLSVRRATREDPLRRWDYESGQAQHLVPVQRGHHYAIVDEADSVLIDEARVPLIISGGKSEESEYAHTYEAADAAATRLQQNTDYHVDTRRRRVELTEEGCERAEAARPASVVLRVHFVEQALYARKLYQRDKEYIVSGDSVAIVDEFTGRMLPDRNWQLGLHQAVQVKEGLPVTGETHTEASVTYQRYFKMYEKLAGMTGTARASSRELGRVYGLKVVPVPTNRPLYRRKMPDKVFRHRGDKERAVVEAVKRLNERGQPVLVGTRSVEKSERLSRRLARAGVEHVVLNAKEHEKESRIVARAGHKGNVCIATNMAGRGTDIKLEAGVAKLGGLYVIGTERHESLRIDQQLAGRCARQGDPGTYEFYVALDDDILTRGHRKLAARLMRRHRARRGRALSAWMRMWFVIAQRRMERESLKGRVYLMDHDHWVDEVKKALGVPSWG